MTIDDRVFEWSEADSIEFTLWRQLLRYNRVGAAIGLLGDLFNGIERVIDPRAAAYCQRDAREILRDPDGRRVSQWLKVYRANDLEEFQRLAAGWFLHCREHDVFNVFGDGPHPDDHPACQLRPAGDDP